MSSWYLVYRRHIAFLWRNILSLLLICFFFAFFASIEPVALRSIVLRYRSCVYAGRGCWTTTIFGVEAVGQLYNQTKDFVDLEGNINHNTDCPSRSTGAYAAHGAASETTPSNRMIGRALSSSSKFGCLRDEVLKAMLYGCVAWSVAWSPRAGHYDTLRRAHHSFLTRCIG